MKIVGRFFFYGLFVWIVMFSDLANATDFVCSPVEVAVFSERVHVRCTNTATDGSDSIRFWSVATNNADHANRFLSTATSALISGRELLLQYTQGDSSGTSFNCRANDCRKVWGILIY